MKNLWAGASCALMVALHGADTIDKALFNPAACTTTQAALRYAAELYASRNSFKLTGDMRQALAREAQNAVGTTRVTPLIYKGKYCEYLDKLSCAKPAFSKNGRYIAFPVASPHRIEFFDTHTCEQTNYGAIAASHVAFMGDSEFVAAIKHDDKDYIMVTQPLRDDLLQIDRNNFGLIPVGNDLCGLAVAYRGRVATVHNNIAYSLFSLAIEYDVETSMMVQQHLAVPQATKGGLKYLTSNLLAMMCENNTIYLCDSRQMGTIACFSGVNTNHSFDADGKGEYICASAHDSKELILFDIGQQKSMALSRTVSDPGIITHMCGDRFICSHEMGVAFLNVKNPQPWLDAVNFFEDKGQMRDLLVCKENGKLLAHYATAERSTFCFGTVSPAYTTNITENMGEYLKPHHVACVYALQKAKDFDDLGLLGHKNYAAAVKSTAEHDAWFTQIVETFAYREPKYPITFDLF